MKGAKLNPFRLAASRMWVPPRKFRRALALCRVAPAPFFDGALALVYLHELSADVSLGIAMLCRTVDPNHLDPRLAGTQQTQETFARYDTNNDGNFDVRTAPPL